MRKGDINQWKEALKEMSEAGMLSNYIKVFQTKERVTTYVATLPKVHILAKYNITGRILLLPIVGKGNVVMNLTNVEIVYQYKWNLKRLEDGEVYYVPEPGARLDMDAQGMTILLDNLFNGDKALLDTTNKFLNDEWREVFDSLQPSFASAISEVITSILNGIFTRVRQQDAWLDVDPESLKIPWYVKLKVGEMSVLMGSDSPVAEKYPDQEVRRAVISIEPHMHFNFTTMENDIAILKVSNEMEYEIFFI
ncbi:Putative hemolymph juvenile hormone binding protein [Gryllus bimaculatus]|nr:Putative hemolymph juvenile hormone binding protein [Gryllus bimaculatus]